MIEEFYFKSSTGKDVYAKKWYDENIAEYKGIVQIVHGMEEHIGRYDEFASFLAGNGFIVIGHDHLGHGNTAKGDYGYFCEQKGWFRLAEDIHILQNEIQKQYPNLPYIVMGHSMGSLLVRTYLTIYHDNIKGAILSGTSGRKSGLYAGKLLTKIIMLFKGKKYKSKLVERLVTGSFNKQFKPNRTELDWTTSDEKMIDEHVKDGKEDRKFTVSAYLELFKGSIYLNKKKNIAKTNKVPILIFSGDKDPVGGNGKGVIRVHDMLREVGIEDLEIRLFRDGRHEMLNEVNREEVFEFVLDWINLKIEK